MLDAAHTGHREEILQDSMNLHSCSSQESTSPAGTPSPHLPTLNSIFSRSSHITTKTTSISPYVSSHSHHSHLNINTHVEYFVNQKTSQYHPQQQQSHQRLHQFQLEQQESEFIHDMSLVRPRSTPHLNVLNSYKPAEYQQRRSKDSLDQNKLSK